MDTKKTTGNDNISVKMLKLANKVLSDPLASLVNRSFNEASFPENMKVAQVVLVYKKSSN